MLTRYAKRNCRREWLTSAVCVAATMVLGAQTLPEPDDIRRDELLADWLAQDSGVKAHEDFFAGDVAARYRLALAKHGLSKAGDESWEAALARYREACMKRRAKRLSKLLAMAPRWVYARHAVMGDNIFAYTECLTDPAGIRHWPHRGSGLYYAEPVGDGLWRETPIAETDTGCYRDADVSLDGTRLLYSYKASRDGDDFHLYELEFATGRVRQLTEGKGSADIEGCYLPDGCILFNSTRCSQIVDCWYNDVSTLFRIDADGRNMFRVTFDQVHDIMPTLNADGTVFYTRWEYNDRNELYSQTLFRMMPDGTNQRAAYGANGWFPTALFHARIPFYFQLLDGKGRMVQTMRSWTMLQPGEAASCVGCHESANSAAPTPSNGKGGVAVKKGVLKRPARGFSFAKDVQPILDRRCVKCHSPENDCTLPDLTGRAVHDSTAKRNWSAAYLSLTHATWRRIWGHGKSLWGWVGNPDHLDLNWVSSQSPPTMQRPYGRGSAASRWFTERLERGHCATLTDAERRVLACWVDLSVPFCGAYDEAATWSNEERDRWDRFTEKARRLKGTFK